MIPIGLYSFEFLLICLAYLTATLIWIFWALRLIVRRDIRWQLRAWRGPLFVVLGGIALYSLWSVYALYRHMSAFTVEQQKNFHPVLELGQRLGEIDMPAGTRLSLSIAQQPEAFYIAEFPYAIAVNGVAALRAERYLAHHTDADYRTAGFTPQDLRLTGQGQSQQEGWICDARAPVVFETEASGAIKAFRSCTAAEGNMIQGQSLPKGAEIIVSEGRLYPDGRRALDRWLIHLPQDAPFERGGAMELGGAIFLDADRKVIAP